MPETHIAHISIGLVKYPLDDPRNAEVVNSLEKIYGEAEAFEGFIWRKPDEEIFAELAELGRDPAEILSLTVWTNMDELKQYTYGGLHKYFMDNADKWFDKFGPPALAMWPVDPGNRPTVAEALERLEHLAANGPSDYAFGWDGPNAA